MLFRKKWNRSMEILKERSGKNNETEQDKIEIEENGLPVEKHDVFAMILSALIVIVPIALIVLLVMVLFGSLIFLL